MKSETETLNAEFDLLTQNFALRTTHSNQRVEIRNSKPMTIWVTIAASPAINCQFGASLSSLVNCACSRFSPELRARLKPRAVVQFLSH